MEACRGVISSNYHLPTYMQDRNHCYRRCPRGVIVVVTLTAYVAHLSLSARVREYLSAFNVILLRASRLFCKPLNRRFSCGPKSVYTWLSLEPGWRSPHSCQVPLCYAQSIVLDTCFIASFVSAMHFHEIYRIVGRLPKETQNHQT